MSFVCGVALGAFITTAAVAQSLTHATLINSTTGFEEFDMYQSGDLVHVFGKVHTSPYCRSLDGGRTWSTLEQSLGYFTVSDTAVAGDLLAVIGPSYSANGGPTVAVSNDAGLTWSPSQEITGYAIPTLLNSHSFAIHADGTNVMAVWTESANSTIWAHVSTDGGLTFPGGPTRISAAPVSGSSVISSIRTVKAGPAMHVFWNRKIGNDWFPFMQSTTDAGQTWLSAPRQISTQVHSGFFVVAGDAATLFATSANGLRYSNDNGLTWLTSPLTSMSDIIDIAVDGNRVLVVGYKSTMSGFEWVNDVSLDGGATWPNPYSLATTLGGLWPAPHISGDALYVDLAHGTTGAWSALLRSLDDGASWHIHQSDVNAFSASERRNIHVRRVVPFFTHVDLYAYVGLGYTPVGTGTPGTAGAVPTLAMQGLPTLGATSSFEIDNALGGSIGVLGISSAEPAAIPHGGGELWLQAPLITTTFLTNGASGVGGAGAGSYPLVVPNNPSLTGLSLTAQAAVVDTAANSNFSLTNAIEVWVR